MSASLWLERALFGVLAALATFGLFAHVWLARGGAVPAVALPALLLAALLVPWRTAPWPSAAPAPRALMPIAVLVLAAVFVAIAYGATATSSRHWDGAAAWDTNARFLADGLTLEQPYFRDEAVVGHSRDYPLLQPLLLAMATNCFGPSGGRALFPLVWLLLAGVLGSTLRRAGAGATYAWLGTAAAMLTPILVSPASGGIDSGYGDAFLALATTTMAAGLVRRDARWLAVGVSLAVLLKPEGLVYGAAATVVAFATAERRLLYAAAGGWLLAAACWLPLQRELLHPGSGSSSGWFVALALGTWIAIAAADALARRQAWSSRTRAWAAVALAPVALLALPLAAAQLGAGGAMQSYLVEPARLVSRLADLPAIVLGLAHYALLRGGFGAAFWLLLFGLPVARCRRAQAPLLGLLALGLAIVLVPFLLGHQELQHQLRSSLPRLLLHWLGAAMLFGTLAAATARESSASTEPESHGDVAAEPER